ncbi:MAG: N-acetylmuramoyl-L-alanine amidase [Candidatus Bathyarchaeota archaeon]|nr:N-acetylmuramoyl-L-alanine amidase [Candidatus Bathyarchaeota archaeon]
MDNTQYQIVIDPGHGGEDTGIIGSYGHHESKIMFSLAKMIRDELKTSEYCQATMTRSSDKAVEDGIRAKKGEAKNLFLSLHASTGGISAQYKSGSDGDQTIAKALVIAASNAVSMNDSEPSGVSETILDSVKELDCDYAVTLNIGDLSSKYEANILASGSKLSAIAKAIARTIEDFLVSGREITDGLGIMSLPVDSETSQSSVPTATTTQSVAHLISGAPRCTPGTLLSYLNDHNKSPKLTTTAANLCKYYIQYGHELGIRGDIAFCQALLETGWFRYGGIVKWNFNNYAGIGAFNGNAIGDCQAWDTAEEGVKGHLELLKRYVTVKGINTWEGLNGVWAVPGDTYGQTILKLYSNMTNATYTSQISTSRGTTVNARSTGSTYEVGEIKAVAIEDDGSPYYSNMKHSMAKLMAGTLKNIGTRTLSPLNNQEYTSDLDAYLSSMGLVADTTNNVNTMPTYGNGKLPIVIPTGNRQAYQKKMATYYANEAHQYEMYKLNMNKFSFSHPEQNRFHKDLTVYLEMLYDRLKAKGKISGKLNINSGFRSIAYNQAADGATWSAHCGGVAVDIHAKGDMRYTILDEAYAMGFGGLILYSSWVHIDISGRYFGGGYKPFR